MSENYVLTEGWLYPANADLDAILQAEQESGSDPMIVIKTQGAYAVVTAEQLNPMLVSLIRGHLSGKWCIMIDGRPDGDDEQREPREDTLARHEAVCDELPIVWGKQMEVAQRLGITPRQLSDSLIYLQSISKAISPRRGLWVRVYGGEGKRCAECNCD